MTGYPGLLDGTEFAQAAALKSLCIFMHVGDMDDGWRGPMEVQARQLKAKGYRVAITVEKNQVHRLKAAELNLPQRLLDDIESCASTR